MSLRKIYEYENEIDYGYKVSLQLSYEGSDSYSGFSSVIRIQSLSEESQMGIFTCDFSTKPFTDAARTQRIKEAITQYEHSLDQERKSK